MKLNLLKLSLISGKIIAGLESAVFFYFMNRLSSNIKGGASYTTNIIVLASVAVFGIFLFFANRLVTRELEVFYKTRETSKYFSYVSADKDLKNGSEHNKVLTNQIDYIVQGGFLNGVSLMKTTLMFVSSIGLLFYIYWVLGVIALAALVVVMIVQSFIGNKIGAYYNKMGVEDNQLASDVQKGIESRNFLRRSMKYDIFTNIMSKIFFSRNETITKFNTKALGLIAPIVLVSIFAQEAGVISVSLFSYYGLVDVSVIFSVSFVFGSVFSTVQEFPSLIQTRTNAKHAIKQLYGNKTLNVSGNGDNLTISNFNVIFDEKQLYAKPQFFSFAKGGKYKITGGNGSGKSTLLSTVLFRKNNFEGEVSNDLSINNKNLFYLNSSSYIFEGTVKENILLELDSTTDVLNEIDRLSSITNLKVRDGLINNKSISFGEKQKIGLIRALIRNPGILVLDEATNNIDKKSREAIYKYLFDNDQTLIFVSHKEVSHEKLIIQSVD